MARIIDPCDIVGYTSRNFEKITGVKAGIPVIAGCGDTSASIYGAGVLEKEIFWIVQAQLLCYVLQQIFFARYRKTDNYNDACSDRWCVVSDGIH